MYSWFPASQVYHFPHYGLIQSDCVNVNYMVCGLLLAAFTGSWFAKCVDLYFDLLGSDLAQTVYDKTAQSDIKIWSDPLAM